MAKKRGKGLAWMFYPISSTGNPSAGSAFIKVNHDGTVTSFVGAVDVGQGSTTILTQIIAEELGVEFEDVRMITADSELTPFDSGTKACRVTYVVGNAVKKAAKKAKEILLKIAAIELGLISHEKLVSKKGQIFLESYPELHISIQDAAYASERKYGKPIIAAASFAPTVFALNPGTGHGNPYETHIYATQIVEVEVDTETGEVEVLKVIAVHDCGKAINPMMVEGQIEGGIIMGLGYTLTENFLEDRKNGNILSQSFMDYKLPTIKDIPKICIKGIVEEPDTNGPFGAKGVGEPTPVLIAPAIINAIYDAVGVRIYNLPVTPEKILAALEEKESLEVGND